jgi:hypothetical protein
MGMKVTTENIQDARRFQNLCFGDATFGLFFSLSFSSRHRAKDTYCILELNIIQFGFHFWWVEARTGARVMWAEVMFSRGRGREKENLCVALVLGHHYS